MLSVVKELKRKEIQEALITPVLIPAMKQAAIWGAGSALANKLDSSPPLSPEEKQKQKKKLLKQFAIGAAAGGLSTLV